MAFGARQEDGIWRLCERRGRTIKHVSERQFPTIEVRFPGRSAAEKCAAELNEHFWERYAKRRQKTDDADVFWGILQIIRVHGGITEDDFARIKR